MEKLFMLVHGYDLTNFDFQDEERFSDEIRRGNLSWKIQGDLIRILGVLNIQRLDYAVSLYKSVQPMSIIVAGSYGHTEFDRYLWSKGIGMSTLMREYLQMVGIPREGIFEENKGRNTWDCTLNALQLIGKENGKLRWIVSHKEHLHRVRIQTWRILKERGIKNYLANEDFCGPEIKDPFLQIDILYYELMSLFTNTLKDAI